MLFDNNPKLCLQQYLDILQLYTDTLQSVCLIIPASCIKLDTAGIEPTTRVLCLTYPLNSEQITYISHRLKYYSFILSNPPLLHYVATNNASGHSITSPLKLPFLHPYFIVFSNTRSRRPYRKMVQ